MKRFYYALLFSFIGITLAAQKPILPFVEEGKKWTVFVSDHKMGSIWQMHFGGVNYFMQGDTVIGSHVCKKNLHFQLCRGVTGSPFRHHLLRQPI